MSCRSTSSIRHVLRLRLSTRLGIHAIASAMAFQAERTSSISSSSDGTLTPEFTTSYRTLQVVSMLHPAGPARYTTTFDHD